MLANVCVCTWARVCKGEKRERDLECNGRSRCCSIQGGKAKLTVSQTPSPFSLSGPYLPPSTSTLPFSSLSQHLSSCLHLCRAHFRWQEGGVEGGGGEQREGRDGNDRGGSGGGGGGGGGDGEGGGVGRVQKGEGNKRLHDDCTTIQKLVRGDIPA